VAEDEEGLDLPSVDAAKEEALKGIRSILCEELMHGKLDLKGHIDVADETGSVVETIKFEDAVQIVR
jgi:hypothetical protein